MSVTVDDQPIAAEQLGLATLGELFSHLHQGNRLVVGVTIDGQAPSLADMPAVRQSPLSGRTIAVETVDPCEMSLGVLAQVRAEVEESARLRTEAAELLQQDDVARAMERLRGWIGSWQHAEEAIRKTARLLKLELAAVPVGDSNAAVAVDSFAGQLRQIKTALQSRDYSGLADILLYETEDAADRWNAVIDAVRDAIIA